MSDINYIFIDNPDRRGEHPDPVEAHVKVDDFEYVGGAGKNRREALERLITVLIKKIRAYKTFWPEGRRTP